MGILKTANIHFDAAATNLIDSTTDSIRVTSKGLKLPVGTSAQRPTNATGIIRYNTDIGTLEYANGSSWVNISSIADLSAANAFANVVGVSANSWTNTQIALLAANTWASIAANASAIGTAANNFASSAASGKLANTTTTLNGALTVNVSLGVGTTASGTTGEIRAINNITAFYGSDRLFKTNIRDIKDAIAKVTAIGGKYFDWTDEYIAQHGGEDGFFIRKEDFGVIAQDVQAAFPLAVRTRPDGTLAVDYEKLIALAFAAIVELKQEIDILKGNK